MLNIGNRFVSIAHTYSFRLNIFNRLFPSICKYWLALHLILLSSIISCFLMIHTRFHSIKTNYSICECSLVIDKFETCRKKKNKMNQKGISLFLSIVYTNWLIHDLLHVLSFFFNEQYVKDQYYHLSFVFKYDYKFNLASSLVYLKQAKEICLLYITMILIVRIINSEDKSVSTWWIYLLI